MKFLYKPHQYSKFMKYCEAPQSWLDDLIEHPPVMTSKDRAQLAIFGTPVAEPELDPDSGEMRCTGANVRYMNALALDYDNGMSMREFIEQYHDRAFTLYTSWSYGIKAGDRFRVILPLAEPFPAELLQCRRVRANLMFQYPGVDQCCFDRGHWQILPIRNPEGNYLYYRNENEPWHPTIEIYRAWQVQEKLEREEHMKAAAENIDENTQARLKAWTERKLAELEIGAGTRYAQVKSLLAWAMANGLGDAVLSIPCPWPEPKWEKRWPNLVEWAFTLAK